MTINANKAAPYLSFLAKYNSYWFLLLNVAIIIFEAYYTYKYMDINMVLKLIFDMYNR